MKIKLHWQILIAMAVGVMFALGAGEHSSVVEPLGTIFFRLLKMVVVPLVIFSISAGVASVGNPKTLGRLGLKTVSYYLATSLFAILIGLTLVNLVEPGKAANVAEGKVGLPNTMKKPGSATDLALRIIPDNPVAAAAEGDMLAIIFFCILLGLALTQGPPAIREKLLPLIEAGFQVMMQLTQVIIKLAPLGVFGLMVKMVNQNMGAGFYKAVGLCMFTIAAGLTLHLLVILPLIYFVFMKGNPMRHFSHMASALATVFATSSSLATLPVTLECVERNAGVSNKIAGFVLPMGATVNMDGTALFECTGVLFIAQVLGIPLTMEQQALVVITALLASIGTAAIPSAGLVTIFIILDTIGLQGPLVPVVVGTMLAVDRPLDMYRGIINIFSDSVGAVIIAGSEGEIKVT
ncbi:MAG: dicarboxylate/amino acid:cation symporter [Nitrospinota bacterium]|nr:dicarboxylate/amino acid:cation symporter [Nitrospinota bacterium]